mgnify:FL=1
MEHIQHRMGEKINCHIVVFSEKLGVLVQSENIVQFLKNYHNENNE